MKWKRDLPDAASSGQVGLRFFRGVRQDAAERRRELLHGGSEDQRAREGTRPARSEAEIKEEGEDLLPLLDPPLFANRIFVTPDRFT